jgi:hypothetical protein
MSKTHQVLIASYRKDFNWLQVCLQTLKRFSRGFLPPVVSVASEDAEDTRSILYGYYPGARVVVKDGPAGLGNLRAQVSMMEGDLMCPNADYVWLVGSDCIVSREFTPEPFFRNDKPVMLVNSYETLFQNSLSMRPWQEGTEKALGWKPELEYMRRLPLIYPRELFHRVRGHLGNLHNKPFEDYVYEVGAYAQKSNRSDAANFSESNVMGAFADRFMHDSYEWVSLDLDYPGEMAKLPSPMIQFWSHGGLDKACDVSFNYGDGENTYGKTPREVLRYILSK